VRLTNAGDAYCCGSNSHGQLGKTTAADSKVPVLMTAAKRFASISAGTCTPAPARSVATVSAGAETRTASSGTARPKDVLARRVLTCHQQVMP
jgi:hypothetical protein